MTISRKNSDILNWTSCVVMEQKWYANVGHHCNVHVSVAHGRHGGRTDVNQHLRSQKHNVVEKTLASVENISRLDLIVP